MTKQTKIILAVVGGLLALCLISCVAGFFLLRAAGSSIVQNVSESVENDPVVVQRVGDEIAEFDLPAGYTDATSMDLLGMKLVFWENEPQQGMIMLLQMPMQGEISAETMQQMETAMRQRTDSDLRNLQVIESRDLTIRGEPAKMTILEGEDAETGDKFQQVLVAFQGRGGMALLMMMNPAGGQNLAVFENLVSSIR